MNKKELGDLGEEIAKNFFVLNGYQILQKNFKAHSEFGMSEIDLIVQKENVIAFVEVKTRTTLRFGLPREAVTKKKQEKIIAAAKIFSCQNEISPEINFRFDVVEVYLHNKFKLRHFINAFEA